MMLRRQWLQGMGGVLAGMPLPACRGPGGVTDPASRAVGERLAAQVDGARVLGLARRQVEFGPRPVGSDALAACRDWLQRELEAQGWQVLRQEFEVQTPQGPKTVINLRARFGPSARDWRQPVASLLGAHYDTKWFGDVAFVGANDGASAVAVLLECARVLGEDELGRGLARGVELVLFDGEEALVNFSPPGLPALEPPLGGDGLWGSRGYAGAVRRGEVPPPGRLVLLDIVGDPREPLRLEGECSDRLKASVQHAARAATGRSLEYTAGLILDDHIPFRLVGVDATVLMQSDLLRNGRYWHTERDTLDILDPEALARCARLVLHLAAGTKG